MKTRTEDIERADLDERGQHNQDKFVYAMGWYLWLHSPGKRLRKSGRRSGLERKSGGFSATWRSTELKGEEWQVGCLSCICVSRFLFFFLPVCRLLEYRHTLGWMKLDEAVSSLHIAVGQRSGPQVGWYFLGSMAAIQVYLTSTEFPFQAVGWILTTKCILVRSEIRLVWNSNEVLLLFCLVRSILL